MRKTSIEVNSEQATPEAEPADTMGLREFAATVKLNPLYEVGIAATTLPFDRTLEEWKTALEAFKRRPVRNR